ncbi:MAG: hypothetical protein HY862_21525 [Chloroflexi bacterium]|nr:hypothetical protein [Chloroflexota bacterium]
MKLTVQCIGNGDTALVTLQFHHAPDGQPYVRLTELIRGSDELLLRSVNPEVLAVRDHPELHDLIQDQTWHMEAVEALVLGYLNRQSEVRIRLHQTWEAALRRQWVKDWSAPVGKE